MSIHRSLVVKGSLTRRRSVLTRAERLEKLKQEERWEDGDSVLGLPKVRVSQGRRKKAEKKEAELDEAALDAAEATPEGETETTE